VSTACGSDDGKRANPRDYDAAGSPGNAGDGGSAGSPSSSEAGADGTPDPGSSGAGPSVGGQTGSSAGAATEGGTGDVAGSPAIAGEAGAAGAAGAGNACAGVDGPSLAGVWTTDCNGYSCKITITAEGAMGGGCTNGQYETGTIDDDGVLSTTGEGGPYAAYSTEGPLTRTGCDALTRDYIGQIPPFTGPKLSYSCQLTRTASCAPTLLEAMVGTWETSCGSSTCVTTFTVAGEMSTTCSNGQHSAGSLQETGAFADSGGGGAFSDYSTTGVVALTSCDTFSMPYTWQSPPNQGVKHSQQCQYSRQQ
jgi:hypothetical protein